MTQEQKAKAYDEAIKRAKFLKENTDGVGAKDVSACFEYIFPELKESEGERIRKFLHHTFTAQYLAQDKLGKWHGEPVSNILDWLEKQGQVKESEIPQQENKTCEENSNSLTSEDERIRKAIINVFSTHKDYEMFYGAYVGDIRAWLEKQGEPKTPEYVYITQEVLEYIKQHEKSFGNKKPELGERWEIERVHTYPTANNGKPVIEMKNENGDWMRLPLEIIDRKQDNQKPAEWSEEDERIFSEIILRCKKYGHQEQIDWLKSLKDRYTWKPSEDQMTALAEALSLAKNCGEEWSFDLRTLHEQLKKL